MLLLIYAVSFLSTFVSVHAAAGLASQQQPIQTTSDPFDPVFDDYVEDLLKECHVPGVSIAVVDNGRITSKVSLLRAFLFPLHAFSSAALTLVGLRLRHSPQHKSDCRYTVLYCQHNKSFYCCDCGITRSQYQLPIRPLDVSNQLRYPRRLCARRRMGDQSHNYRRCALTPDGIAGARSHLWAGRRYSEQSNPEVKVFADDRRA